MNKAALIAALAAVIAHGAASRAQEVPVEEPAVEEGTAAEVAEEELAAEEEASDAIALPAATIGALTLQPTLEAGLAYFTQSNSWYGRSTANLGKNSDRWVEGYVTPGFDYTFELGEPGRIEGSFNVVGAFTHGTDAAGTNVGNETPTDVAINKASIGWNSGALFADSLGEDAVDLSFGRQNFKLGTGFLLWDGASNGGDRGAYWLSPREAYQAAGIAELETHGFTARASIFSPTTTPTPTPSSSASTSSTRSPRVPAPAMPRSRTALPSATTTWSTRTSTPATA